MSRSTKLACGLAILLALAWLPGCPGMDEQVVGLDPEQTIAPGIIVSNPLSTAQSPSASAQPAGLSFTVVDPTVETEIVYVSLAAGSYSSGASAVIKSPRAPGAITATMINGGLDPVPVPAIAGDTIDVEILDIGGLTLASERVKVPPRRPPRVVRTAPPRGKTDIAINSSIIVVFSEPVSEATISDATVGLRLNGQPVAGTVRLLSGTGTIAAFTPNAALRSNTAYQLMVSNAIVDREGEALEAPVSLTFTTGESLTGPPQWIRVSPDTAYLLDNTFQLTATVTDAAGNELIDQPVIWESSDPAGLSVSSTGLLTPVTSGNYFVTARIGDVQGRATVYVRGPPASVGLSPSPVTLFVEESIVLVATVRDAGGFVLDSPVIWTSDAPEVAVTASVPVGAMLARVTGVTPGTANITATTATGDPVRATTAVTVGPRRAAASVTVTPAAPTLIVGEVAGLSATPRDLNGSPISGRPISWASDNPSVATVSANGQLTAISAGTAHVTATSEGVSGTATVTVMMLNFASVSAGDLHTCGLTVQGAAYCWGGLLSFEIGVDAKTSRPVAVLGGVQFASLAAGGFHTCGLTSDGTAYCWGSGGEGRLGDGADRSSATPVRVAGGLSFSALTTAYHSCGLSTTGDAYCWGRNGTGQLGDGTTTTRLAPTRVAGDLTFQSLAAGSYEHTCGLTTNFDAYCWGRNGQGELGDGSATDSHVPVRVRFALGFSAVVAGGAHTCGLTPEGNAYCWGGARLLGNSVGASSSLPRAVEGGLTFTALSAGISHTCGLTSDGFVYCWGRNNDGQLGDGTTSDKLLPTRVSGGNRYSSVSAGGWHTCGRSTDGIAYCWGLNTVGMLGNGSTINSTVPVKVVGQP